MKKRVISLLCVIISIAIALRIYRLGDRNLWHDEIFAIFFHRFSFPDITRVLIRAPLHIVVVNIVTRLFYRNEFWTRLPAMIFGCASIPFVYLLGKRLFNRHVGLVGAFLLAISPFHIWYSQTAVRYTQAVFFITLSSYLFICCVREDKNWLWIIFSFIQIMAVYTSYLSFIMIVPQMAILFLLERGKYVKKLVLSWSVVILFFLPWVTTFLHQISSLYENFWIPDTKLFFIYATLCNFNLGFTVTTQMFFISFVFWLSIFVFSLLPGCKEYRQSLVVTLLFCLLPIVSIFIISLWWKAIYLSRLMILFLPFYLLIISFGIYRINKTVYKMIVLCIIALFTSISLRNYYLDRMPAPSDYRVGTYIKKPFEPMIQFIKDNFQEGDKVVVTSSNLDLPLWYYWGDEYRNEALYFMDPNTHDEYFKKAYSKRYTAGLYLSRGSGPDPVVDISRDPQLPYKRMWVLSSNWARDGDIDENSRAVRYWLEKRFHIILNKDFQGILVTLYAPGED